MNIIKQLVRKKRPTLSLKTISWLTQFQTRLYLFQLQEQKIQYLVRSKQTRTLIEIMKRRKLTVLVVLFPTSYLFYQFLQMKIQQNHVTFNSYYQTMNRYLKELTKQYIKTQVTKHVWFSDGLINETAISINQLCHKQTIHNKTAFNLSKVVRLKELQTNSFKLSKDFVRTNLIYKHDIVQKSKNLAVSTVKKEETRSLMKHQVRNFFDSDAGKANFVNNLSNSFLNQGVLNQFMNSSKNFIYDQFEDKQNIELAKQSIDSNLYG